MLLKKILFFIGFGMILISPSFAQTPTENPADTQAFKQQLQQLRDQISQAIQSGNQQEVQKLKAEEDAMILQHMQHRSAKKLEWQKTHPSAPSQDPNVQWQNAQLQLKIQMQDAINSGDTKKAEQLKAQLAANAGEKFAQIRAKRQAWLQAHPEEAAKQAQHDQFVKSILPLFYELGAAVKSGDTQKAQQIRDQMAAARKQWEQTGQIPQIK